MEIIYLPWLGLSLASIILFWIIVHRYNRKQVIGIFFAVSFVLMSAAIGVLADELKVTVSLAILLNVFALIHMSRAFSTSVAPQVMKQRIVMSSKRFSLAFIAFWLFLVVTAGLTNDTIATIFMVISAAYSMSLLITSLLRLKSTAPDDLSEAPQVNEQLPTITLAIPARNENHALHEAIESALSIDYPKLEVIVFDDCSQDKTSQIIKSYAHAGVRFIQTDKLQDNWLGKNYAYQQLLEEASGEYICFAGVDVHFSGGSMRMLLHQMSARNVEMISVMPIQRGNDLAPSMFRSLRYYWQFALPHFPYGDAPALSSIVMIRRKLLLKMGGFKGLRRAILPEKILARELNSRGKYAFVRSNSKLGISFRKRLSSQFETSLRTLYPQFHSEFVYGVFGLLLLAIICVAPVVVLFSGAPVAQLLALTSLVCFVLSHMAVNWAISSSTVLFGLVGIPFVVIVELYLLLRSILLYEFEEVIWKGRNVCYVQPEE